LKYLNIIFVTALLLSGCSMTYESVSSYKYSAQYGFDSKIEAINFHDYLVDNGFERQLSLLFDGSNEAVEGISLHWKSDGLKSSSRTVLIITYEADLSTKSKNEEISNAISSTSKSMLETYNSL